MLELSREQLYQLIIDKGITHKDTVRISQELDKKVLDEMLTDPVIENIYLKNVLKAKDEEIKRLQRSVLELSEKAVMLNEIGIGAVEAIGAVAMRALQKGLINEIGVHGIRKEHNLREEAGLNV